MDNFLAPHSTEAMAHSKLRYAFDESLVAHYASYHANLFIPPRFPSELERILSRQTLKAGGYSRVWCFLSFHQQSIRNVLNTEDNARRLLAWHRPNTAPSPVTVDMTHTNSGIKV
ncbi:hypothetical protein EV424DRAFT_1367315 [Suillus variegatus]|nr:hypothetical protein EV424DRAFT_1367315 [Suillus variegatus]